MSSEIILNITLVCIAVVSLVVSFLTFWRNRRSTRLKKEQESQILILASGIVILWEQILVLITANVNKSPLQPYIFDSLRKNASRLEDNLQNAIGLGLWSTIIGKQKASVTLYSAFIQSLIYASTSQENDTEPWLKLHLHMGMIRALEICVRYRSNLVSEVVKPTIEKVSKDLRRKAWNYLWEKDLKEEAKNGIRINDIGKVKRKIN